ncbi:hypothetical protein HH310_19155 [Actinoplanes sp. TBRC 11911]|uniref:hypothetical protein n=1 Tax=Actinoplanes sp. TBRC 11911 TaxID=2729386 RepID=UPI00145CAEFB|nr:hypothetical protein [Actinoplanes sp. TBRC 11911]NMO53303.1 hypothetical protein [Actinoplanes sp. TBRC 11911]
MTQRDDAEHMEIILAAFVLVILVASIAGWTVDTRDSADWKPTNGGFRSNT